MAAQKGDRRLEAGRCVNMAHHLWFYVRDARGKSGQMALSDLGRTVTLKLSKNNDTHLSGCLQAFQRAQTCHSHLGSCESHLLAKVDGIMTWKADGDAEALVLQERVVVVGGGSGSEGGRRGPR